MRRIDDQAIGQFEIKLAQSLELECRQPAGLLFRLTSLGARPSQQKANRR